MCPNLCPFDLYDHAYKQGIRAGRKGLLRTANPYEHNRESDKLYYISHTQHSGWLRGWLSVTNKK